MKKFFLILLLALPTAAAAQQDDADDMSRYLAGAVPLKDGYVHFEKTYKATGKTRGELFRLLLEYTQKQLVEGENQLEQSRITEADSTSGIIAASMDEWLYFKKKAWVSHRTRFFYQLVYHISDGSFTIEMRRIHYLYEETEVPGITTNYPAEKWITDEEALNKDKTRLTRIGGKFRRFTIDRKDEIFRGAARAAGALKRVTRVVEAEEE